MLWGAAPRLDASPSVSIQQDLASGKPLCGGMVQFAARNPTTRSVASGSMARQSCAGDHCRVICFAAPLATQRLSNLPCVEALPLGLDSSPEPEPRKNGSPLLAQVACSRGLARPKRSVPGSVRQVWTRRGLCQVFAKAPTHEVGRGLPLRRCQGNRSFSPR